jgi:hypothetical protein
MIGSTPTVDRRRWRMAHGAPIPPPHAPQNPLAPLRTLYLVCAIIPTDPTGAARCMVWGWLLAWRRGRACLVFTLWLGVEKGG